MPTALPRALALAALTALAPLPCHAIDVQAHRGGRGLAAENSMAAFRRSIELGVPTLELDLQSTRDRVLVVHHDAQFDADRCRGLGAAPSRRFADLTAADVDSLRCDGEPVPPFDAVLQLAGAAPYAVRLNVEIKNQDGERGLPVGDIAGLVAKAVTSHGLAGRVIVQSFDPSAIRAMRGLAPEVATAILARDRGDFDRLLDASGAGILSPRADELRREDVQRCHARGVMVVPWVVNDPGDAGRLASWGVDGLISDRPDLVMRALAAPPASMPTPSRGRALDLRDVGTVAVYPFTSGGNVDTFCTSLFVQELNERDLFRRVIDPYELSIAIPDGEPFQPQAVLASLLDEARGKGADAVLVGEGRWYDWGFRIEVRMIEVNEGRVVWQCALRSGMTVSGPAAKKELARKAARDLEKGVGTH